MFLCVLLCPPVLLCCAVQELIKQKLSASGGGNSSTPVLNNSSSVTGQHTYYPRSVMYGCTELTSGDNFVKQLQTLGAGKK